MVKGSSRTPLALACAVYFSPTPSRDQMPRCGGSSARSNSGKTSSQSGAAGDLALGVPDLFTVGGDFVVFGLFVRGLSGVGLPVDGGLLDDLSLEGRSVETFGRSVS